MEGLEECASAAAVLEIIWKKKTMEKSSSAEKLLQDSSPEAKVCILK